MIIISHRGYWKSDIEKNSIVAFERSFRHGFGTETDIRDSNGVLVISHDMPCGDELTFTEFLELSNLFASDKKMLQLALNVKADGLALPICSAIKNFKNLDCFVFDMSVPDMQNYLKRDIPVFTRMSEVEQQPVWLDRCSGVWLDSFESEWFSNTLIIELLRKQKRVCIVSPDLHRRDYSDLWIRIKPLANEPKLILCTDFPEQARDFFQIS